MPKTYGSNYDRLMTLKSKFDPTNFFSPQSKYSSALSDYQGRQLQNIELTKFPSLAFIIFRHNRRRVWL